MTCTASSENNANPTTTSVSYPNTIQYTCAEGYKYASGQLTRTCQADGSLTGTAPMCTGRLEWPMLEINNILECKIEIFF